jgi:hypothetical protein
MNGLVLSLRSVGGKWKEARRDAPMWGHWEDLLGEDGDDSAS